MISEALLFLWNVVQKVGEITWTVFVAILDAFVSVLDNALVLVLLVVHFFYYLTLYIWNGIVYAWKSAWDSVREPLALRSRNFRIHRKYLMIRWGQMTWAKRLAAILKYLGGALMIAIFLLVLGHTIYTWYKIDPSELKRMEKCLPYKRPKSKKIGNWFAQPPPYVCRGGGVVV